MAFQQPPPPPPPPPPRSQPAARAAVARRGSALLNTALAGAGASGLSSSRAQHLARSALPQDPTWGGREIGQGARPAHRRMSSSETRPVVVRCGRDRVELKPGDDVVAIVQHLCQVNACEDRIEPIIAHVRAELERLVSDAVASGKSAPAWQKQVLSDIGRNDFAATRPKLGRGRGAQPAAHALQRSRGRGRGGRPGFAPSSKFQSRERTASAASTGTVTESEQAGQPLSLRCGRETVVIEPGMNAAAVKASVHKMMEAKGDVEGVDKVLRSLQRQLDRSARSLPRWAQHLSIDLGRF